MAYITTEEVKEIRTAIKSKFPIKAGWKFSITREHSSTLRVVILNAPYELRTKHERNYQGLNENYLEDSHQGEQLEALQEIVNICMANHWDESDSMTDYFNCSFYFNISVGSYDKEFNIMQPKFKMVA